VPSLWVHFEACNTSVFIGLLVKVVHFEVSTLYWSWLLCFSYSHLVALWCLFHPLLEIFNKWILLLQYYSHLLIFFIDKTLYLFLGEKSHFIFQWKLENTSFRCLRHITKFWVVSKLHPTKIVLLLKKDQNHYIIYTFGYKIYHSYTFIQLYLGMTTIHSSNNILTPPCSLSVIMQSSIYAEFFSRKNTSCIVSRTRPKNEKFKYYIHKLCLSLLKALSLSIGAFLYCRVTNDLFDEMSEEFLDEDDHSAQGGVLFVFVVIVIDVI